MFYLVFLVRFDERVEPALLEAINEIHVSLFAHIWRTSKMIEPSLLFSTSR